MEPEMKPAIHSKAETIRTVKVLVAAWAVAMLVALAVIVGSALISKKANAQGTNPGQFMVPIGYCQISAPAAATKLSTCAGGIPANARMAYIVVETGAVRYRDDGVAPTAAVGMPIAIGGSLFYTGTLSSFQVIQQAASVVNILFYR
jgi:hypothetical protein